MNDPRLCVYIAAPFQRWGIAEGIGQHLEHQGCRVVSSWIDVAGDLRGVERLDSEADARAAARVNDRDLESAHVVLVLAFPGEGRAMYGEARIAIEYGIPVVWCGPPCLDAMRDGVVRKGRDVMRAEWEDAAKAIADAAGLCRARKILAWPDPVMIREAVFSSLRGVDTDGARRAAG